MESLTDKEIPEFLEAKVNLRAKKINMRALEVLV